MAAAKPEIDVVAAVIRGVQRQILISLRAPERDQGGLWEFPGGKREAGESRIDALARELHEELNIALTHALPLIHLHYEYPDKIVHLDVWDVYGWRGDVRGMEGQKFRWVSAQDLDQYTFPAANRTIVTAARLPRLATTRESLKFGQQWLALGRRARNDMRMWVRDADPYAQVIREMLGEAMYIRSSSNAHHDVLESSRVRVGVYRGLEELIERHDSDVDVAIIGASGSALLGEVPSNVMCPVYFGVPTLDGNFSKALGYGYQGLMLEDSTAGDHFDDFRIAVQDAACQPNI